MKFTRRWIGINPVRSHIRDQHDDIQGAINDYILRKFMERLSLQYEADMIKEADIPWEVEERGEGEVSKTSYNTTISYDFDKDMNLLYNSIVTKYVNSVAVIVKKIGTQVKDAMVNGKFNYGTYKAAATKKDQD